MPNKLVIQQLDRITLVRKGRATAKHPELREGVVEVVKAAEDWYENFALFIQQTEDEDIPADWVSAYIDAELGNLSPEELVEKSKSHAGAKPGKNYANSKGPFAGPHNSFPIQSQQDVYNAARLVGHAQDPAAVKARIIRIAHSKGFSLPKSWQSKVKKSELIAQLKGLLGIEVEDDEPEKPEGEGEPVEKAGGEPLAKAQNHTHEHPHQSLRGYGYSHSHSHGHKGGVMPNTNEHDSSDVAHAHDHLAKAGENPETDGLIAENDGLAKDLEAAKTEVKKAQDAEVAAQTVIKSLQEKLEASEKALKESRDKLEAVEKAKSESEALLKAQSREPVVGAPVTNTVNTKVDISTMSFDKAFDAVLHG